MIGPSTAGAGADATARLVHDLHGPLTVIRGLCATLARDEPRPERRRALDLIDGETLRLAAGLEWLGRSARRATPEPPRADLAVIARSAAERFAPVAAERGVRIVVRGAGTPQRVLADPADVERALDNLIRNGIRHAREDGVLLIGLSRRAGRAHLRVRDDGDGVAAADRERIFRAGERGSSPRGPGRGLGLRIAREMAERNGGRLTLDPVGEGACFRLVLALAPGEGSGEAA
jgi:two-component system sensor histidine kinase QseC